MAGHSVRFIQSGCLRLGEPLLGIAEPPEHLREVLVNATYDAAARVFQAAVREEVDFVLLCGDLLDATAAGPRAVAFLDQQFRELAKHSIPVVWAASQQDLRDNLVRSIGWPDNVHLLASDRVECVTLEVEEGAVAILGRSWHPQRAWRGAEFTADATAARRIHLLPARIELEAAVRATADYWAMGGDAAPDTQHLSDGVVHLAGSPQGLHRHETGEYACSLVHLEPTGGAHIRRVDTDSVRWQTERLNVSAGASRGDLQNELPGRVRALAADAGRPLLVSWLMTGLGRFNSAFVRARRREELLEWARDEFGTGKPPVWSLGIELEAPHAMRAEWCDEDSILGDYMRVIREFDEDQQTLRPEPLRLGRSLPAAADFDPTDVENQEWLLREAAMWGLDLLRGDEQAVRDPALLS